jgi:hypothetical protein
VGSEPPNDHSVSSRASAKPTSWQARATRRSPPPGAGSAPLPAISSVTGEQAVVGSRPPEGGATYAAVLAGPATPHHPSGSLKPRVMDSEPCEPAVSSETAIRRISNDMSGPLSDKPDGTTQHDQVTTSLPGKSFLTRRPFLFQVLVTPVVSRPGCGRLALAA